jgi:SulP family sulfate permease
VETDPRVLSVRVDESLYFANARFLEDQLLAWVTARPEVEDVVLLCSAVNGMDGSAVETLESLNARLRAASVRLHLSEVKGPVMDRLRRTHLLSELTGEVFFTHHRAMTVLLGRETSPASEGALPA